MKYHQSFRMVQEEEETWIADHRVGETGLSDPGLSTQSDTCGIHGTTPAATKFLYCAAMFDMEYARWLDENCKHMSGLQGAIQAQLPDGDLGVVVDHMEDSGGALLPVDGRIQALRASQGEKDPPLSLLDAAIPLQKHDSCFLADEPEQMVVAQLDPLTEQQFMGICNLQQSSQQVEEALSQGLEQLHHSLADAIAGGFLGNGVADGSYMVIALGKLDNLEGLVRQADKLRQQTLHQLRRLFTTIQAAKCFLAIGEYYARLRALSSLWASRPRESLIRDDGVVSTSTDLQIVHEPLQNHFPYLPL
ncbi:hypothetical protein BHE74_00006333 [Ensete ventricosum]|nr:hypothetical protein BHE74_00006333 [Ensete ventricosum]